MWLLDLDKAFGRFLREVIRWALHDKLGVEEWLVLAFMSMYTGARTVYGDSKRFEVKVGICTNVQH